MASTKLSLCFLVFTCALSTATSNDPPDPEIFIKKVFNDVAKSQKLVDTNLIDTLYDELVNSQKGYSRPILSLEYDFFKELKEKITQLQYPVEQEGIPHPASSIESEVKADQTSVTPPSEKKEDMISVIDWEATRENFKRIKGIILNSLNKIQKVFPLEGGKFQKLLKMSKQCLSLFKKLNEKEFPIEDCESCQAYWEDIINFQGACQDLIKLVGSIKTLDDAYRSRNDMEKNQANLCRLRKNILELPKKFIEMDISYKYFSRTATRINIDAIIKEAQSFPLEECNRQ